MVRLIDTFCEFKTLWYNSRKAMRIFCTNNEAKGRKKKLEEDSIQLWYLGVCLQRCWHQFDMASAEKVSFFTFLHLAWSVTAFTNFTNSYLLELWVFTYAQAINSRESLWGWTNISEDIILNFQPLNGASPNPRLTHNMTQMEVHILMM